MTTDGRFNRLVVAVYGQREIKSCKLCRVRGYPYLRKPYWCVIKETLLQNPPTEEYRCPDNYAKHRMSQTSVNIHEALQQALETEVAESACWFPVTVEELVTWAIIDTLKECWFDRMDGKAVLARLKELDRAIGMGEDADYWEEQYRKP